MADHPVGTVAEQIVDLLIEDPRWSEIALADIAERSAAATLGYLGVSQGREISVLACDDARIAALNGDFRGRARPTNVLSWPSAERGAARAGTRPVAPPAHDVELGDIALAFETCRDEAVAAAIPFPDHVSHLIVHAVLHLLGYDHERPGDGDLMEASEVEILARMGLPDPYARQNAAAGKVR